MYYWHTWANSFPVTACSIIESASVESARVVNDHVNLWNGPLHLSNTRTFTVGSIMRITLVQYLLNMHHILKVQ